MRDGQPFKTDALKLKPGSQIFTYQTTLPDGPLISYRVSSMPQKAEFDNYAPDNQGFAWITVRSKAKVLLLNPFWISSYMRKQALTASSDFPPLAKVASQKVLSRNWHPVIIKPRCRSQLPVTTVSNLPRSGAAGE